MRARRRSERSRQQMLKGRTDRSEKKLVELHRARAQVKQIVTYFRRSISSSDALRAAQRQKGVLVPLELIQAVQTRWNSTFYSLQRFADLGRSVTQGLAPKDHRTAPPMLTSEELAVANYLGAVLGPFDKATKEISATVLDPRFKLLHFQVPINTGNILQWLSREMNSEVSSSSTPQRTTGQGCLVSAVQRCAVLGLTRPHVETVEHEGNASNLNRAAPGAQALPDSAPGERTKCPLKFWSDRDKTSLRCLGSHSNT
ncbi:hypothetical protein GWK47_015771 [Chionoecetes opilio]|uniref:Transposase n=1 Tax=Chionoecetes opilio TaxID=41210 RepID=A0A8J4XTW3_CHIOP|nr:hypothetical protein GWK47_015771 [Chionoecetes opilio]